MYHLDTASIVYGGMKWNGKHSYHIWYCLKSMYQVTWPQTVLFYTLIDTDFPPVRLTDCWQRANLCYLWVYIHWQVTKTCTTMLICEEPITALVIWVIRVVRMRKASFTRVSDKLAFQQWPVSHLLLYMFRSKYRKQRETPFSTKWNNESIHTQYMLHISHIFTFIPL